MLFLPLDRPVIENLNSYYVDTEKLIEHYQGELGSGGVRFRAASAEAVVIFDQDQVLSSRFRDKDGEREGAAAMDVLAERAARDSFTIGVYAVDPVEACYWAGLSSAERLYSDLSTEFTDLEGLVGKMRAEGLTGYIGVIAGKGRAGGFIFFLNGEIIGTAGPGDTGPVDRSDGGTERLIRETKAAGGVFHVSRISRTGKPDAAGAGGKDVPGNETLDMLASMLGILERTAQSRRKLKGAFGTALKKKFVEKADAYPFLDPFAGEFQYAEGRILFTGKADRKDLVTAVTACAGELADEWNILPLFRRELTSWSQKYAKELAALGSVL